MELSPGKVRALRLHAHHLDRPLPAAGLAEAAGACGMQNSPPGAWETAAFNRVEDCSVCSLHTALYHDKTLLQAWSWRGVPAVFPAEDAGMFLAPLFPHPGEEPWIYTRGMGLALDLLGMTADALLPLGGAGQGGSRPPAGAGRGLRRFPADAAETLYHPTHGVIVPETTYTKAGPPARKPCL